MKDKLGNLQRNVIKWMLKIFSRKIQKRIKIVQLNRKDWKVVLDTENSFEFQLKRLVLRHCRFQYFLLQGINAVDRVQERLSLFESSSKWRALKSSWKGKTAFQYMFQRGTFGMWNILKIASTTYSKPFQNVHIPISIWTLTSSLLYSFIKISQTHCWVNFPFRCTLFN